jgi:hypothetical protein
VSTPIISTDVATRMIALSERSMPPGSLKLTPGNRFGTPMMKLP